MANTRIEVKFVCGASKKRLFVGMASYRSASTKTDTFSLYNKAIVIDMNRMSTQAAPLKQHNSTLYKQIVKAICLYYVLERKPRSIREITITQHSGSTEVCRKIFSRACQKFCV